VDYHAASYLAGGVFVAFPLLLGVLKAGKAGGRTRKFAFLYGADGRRSTSKLTAYAWLVALLGALAMLLSTVVLESDVAIGDVGVTDLDVQYLILIGAPLGTALLSKGIVQAKAEAGTLQKVEATQIDGTGGFLLDDDGRADLIDIQYLGFNGLLLTYFVTAVLSTPMLPTLPETLVGLTGASAAAYVAGKAVERNAPSITSVTVTAAQSDGSCIVRIRGQHLIGPPTAKLSEDTAKARIGIHGVDVRAILHWTADGTSVDVEVAPVPVAGARVSLTTTAGVTVTDDVP